LTEQAFRLLGCAFEPRLISICNAQIDRSPLTPRHNGSGGDPGVYSCIGPATGG
jgi:hypothetical protein